jgi:hypothetical protein
MSFDFNKVSSRIAVKWATNKQTILKNIRYVDSNSCLSIILMVDLQHYLIYSVNETTHDWRKDSNRIISSIRSVLIISLENTNLKCAKMGRRTYQRRDQVPKRSKYPLSSDHTHHEPHLFILYFVHQAVKLFT